MKAATPVRRSARLARLAQQKGDEAASACKYTTPTKTPPKQKQQACTTPIITKDDEQNHDDTKSKKGNTPLAQHLNSPFKYTTPTKTPPKSKHQACKMPASTSAKKQFKEESIARAKNLADERKKNKGTKSSIRKADDVENLVDNLQCMTVKENDKNLESSVQNVIQALKSGKIIPDNANNGSGSSDLSPSTSSDICDSEFSLPSSPFDSEFSLPSSDEETDNSGDDSDDSVSITSNKRMEERTSTSYSYSFAATPQGVNLAADRKQRAEEDAKRQAAAEQKRKDEEAVAKRRAEEDAAAERQRKAKEDARKLEESSRRKEQADALKKVLRRAKYDGCHYKVLGVDARESAAGIKQAYKRLALLLHPDKVMDKNKMPDSEDAFKVISEAYAVLRCANKRAEYDRSRQTKTAPPPEQPGFSTRGPPPDLFTPGSTEFNTISSGSRVTLHNLNQASRHLHGQTGVVTHYSRSTKQYKIQLNNTFFGGGGAIDADPVCLFQNVVATTRWYSTLAHDCGVHSVTVDSYNEDNGMYQVSYLLGGFNVSHLQPYEMIFPEGTVVRLVNLGRTPEHNGKYGKIVKWTERSDPRTNADISLYTVQLSRDSFVHVKAAHVRL